MRKIALALFTALMTSFAAPAMAQSWSSSTTTFVQTQNQDDNRYILTFSFDAPASTFFEAGTLGIIFPESIFEFVSFKTGAGYTPSTLIAIEGGPVNPGDLLPGTLETLENGTVPPVQAFPDIVPAGMKGLVVLLLPADSSGYNTTVEPGALFGLELSVRPDSDLGETKVHAYYEFLFADDVGGSIDELKRVGFSTFTTTIVPVPEPETWAMMLAGIALVGFAAARARRKA